MTDAPTPPPGDSLTPASGSRLWIERRGPRSWLGFSESGAQVRIGDDPDAFSPGELLKIALAGCSGLTADAALARRLGDDVAASIEVGGTSDAEQDRYTALADRLTVDLSGLDAEARRRLLLVVHRAVEQHCTVGRTLTAGATVTFTVAGEA